MRTQCDSSGATGMPSGWRRLRSAMTLGLLLGFCTAIPWSWAEEAGVTDKTIRIGATIPLEGDYKVYGLAMKQGMDAALAGQTVQKRSIEFVAINDFYDPAKAVEAAKKLIGQGIFAMVNSFGSPTTRAVLPVLAENKVPAFGFYTGAAFTGPGEVLNFRASYANEVETVVDAALAAGFKPTEVCAYAQNDAYGMGGVKGFRTALAKQPGTEQIVAKVDEILNMPGDNPERNGIGPVGVYQRDTVSAREGYQSLKQWEAASGNRCRLVATTAVYDPAATFMGYARYKGEPWIFSSPSPAAGIPLATRLKEHGIIDKVIATQIVPSPDSSLPMVLEARKALGANLNYESLESYIVGKLFVTIMQAIDGPLTRENFLKAARRQPYDIGGVKVDFTTDNQGSDFVQATYLRDGQFTALTTQELTALFK
ncbi:MAG TPA: ABC transporter substrate-binding protein [Candidatus Competibacteraceae bacterium]|nr:ABC transporter substrate-binding protein [Candidatus Competibacteraceae bacterium]HRZ06447.1 ABC transporter substrate-binding protein [Candidatus Competibacteraceae bacterium]HSA46657.1 ABC transporter substrate-binding protein [Candidatus Competibacteraceae bacterium]